MKAFFLLLAWFAFAGSGQVVLTGELGWDGQAVSSEINPLWVHALNEGTTTINGELVVHQRIGSAWRGEADRRMRVPAPLVPGGTARWVLPWHLGPGGTELTVRYEAAGEILATQEVDFSLATRPLRVHVGRLAGEAAPGTVVLDPGELPLDLTVYSGVSTVVVDDALRLPADVRAVVDGWTVLLSTQHDASGPVPHPSSEQLRAILADASLESGRWWAYVFGTACFVLVALWLLRRWARGVARWAGAALAAVIGLALFTSVLYETPHGRISYYWSLEHDQVDGYALAWYGVFTRTDREVHLEGLWTDLLAADEMLAGRDLTWTRGRDGWETRASLVGGEIRTLWSIGPCASSTVPQGWDTSPAGPPWAWLDDHPVRVGEISFFQRTITGEGKKEVEHHARWATTP